MSLPLLIELCSQLGCRGVGHRGGSVLDFVVIFRIFVPVSSSLFFCHIFLVLFVVVVFPVLFVVLCFWRGGR